MAADRWDRLVQTLAEHGIEAKVYSRGPGSRFISLSRPGGIVEIHDTWWPKNHDVWTGWQVWVEGRDSIVIREWDRTKKRGQVARDAIAALELVA